jgi:hypothetical protein
MITEVDQYLAFIDALKKPGASKPAGGG